jgi:hypothetical protein
VIGIESARRTTVDRHMACRGRRGRWLLVGTGWIAADRPPGVDRDVDPLSRRHEDATRRAVVPGDAGPGKAEVEHVHRRGRAVGGLDLEEVEDLVLAVLLEDRREPGIVVGASGTDVPSAGVEPAEVESADAAVRSMAVRTR